MTGAGASELEVSPDTVGRYKLCGQIGRGGMASVHLAKVTGPAGFTKTVAVKQLHTETSADPAILAMFVDEVRLASQINHPNVVSILDVVQKDSVSGPELLLVMDYVRGASLAQLQREAVREMGRMPSGIVLRLLTQALYGLHAAHEARADDGERLDIVHRDVSPQNILVGVDGVARLTDFGVAKAAWRVQSTANGQVKGKLSYMSPEQISGREIDARSDLFSMGVVAWELLAGQQLFSQETPAATLQAIALCELPEIRSVVPGLSEAAGALLKKALAREPEDRFESALAFAAALESLGGHATQQETSEFVRHASRQYLADVDKLLAQADATKTAGAVASAETVGVVATGSGPDPEETCAMDEHFSSNSASVSTIQPATVAIPRKQPKRRAIVGIAALAIGGAAAAALWMNSASPVPESDAALVGMAAGSAPVDPGDEQPKKLSLSTTGGDAPTATGSDVRLVGGSARSDERSGQVAASPVPLAPATLAASDLSRPKASKPRASKPKVSKSKVSKSKVSKSKVSKPKANEPAPVDTPVAPAPPPPPRPDCTMPYDIDDKGIKTWKRECLK